MTTKAPATAVPTTPTSTRLRYYTDNFTLFFLAFIGGLALSRILFEAFFPQLLWLGRPYGAFPFALLTTVLIWVLWSKFTIHNSQFTIHNSLSPFFLNLLWLFNPTVDLTASRFIFVASVWLTAVLITTRDWEMKRLGDRAISQSPNLPISQSRWPGLFFVIIALLPIYLLTMSSAVGTADTFEFQVVTPKLGIVHPTGYPLYLLLGKLFTLLPVGSLAWRLNLASVVYALAAVSLFYLLLYRLTRQPLPAILGATITGLSLTFWSQAIVAEVYALHALVVTAVLYLMAEIGDWRLSGGAGERRSRGAEGMRRTGDAENPSPHYVYLLAFILGLGLTHHLTTVFLIPSAVLTIALTQHATRNTDYRVPSTDYRFYLKVILAFLLPLLLYAYLPTRWQVVNGEAMGLARFVDWVVGGRFQAALQWRAWLDDPTRYEIVGRLFLENWGWFNLVVAAVGFVFLWRWWRTAVPLFLVWLGYTFYALNYYVPDLAVFVIPAQLVIGMWWGVGTYCVLRVAYWLGKKWVWGDLTGLVTTLLVIPTILLAVEHWGVNDQSGDDGLEAWGRAVLGLPLAEGAAILADSEKIAPLLYLQVAEGLRPDLDISVWPDEAAYREQVDGRLAANQPVYLARFLPGLQSIYHLRSLGPLTEVSNHPITQYPNLPIPQSPNLNFGSITLIAYELEPVATVDENSTAVTFYWQANEPISQTLNIYVKFAGHKATSGQHPANNFYPTNAWRPGEIVSDYHLLPRPILAEAQTLNLQVALAPPFTPPDSLEWQTVTAIPLPVTNQPDDTRPYRTQIGSSLITAATFPHKTRPQTSLPLLIYGLGVPLNLEISLEESEQSGLLPITDYQSPITDYQLPFIFATEVTHTFPNGRYLLTLAQPDEAAVCGWLQPISNSCALGEVEISGVALPETAVNYEDKVALLDINLLDPQLQPGGTLQVDINWLALATMSEDYTLFLQVVDENDRIVGQIDSWPVQGTYPTSRWQPGETVPDSYTIQLDSDLPPGQYRLLVGWYLLGTSRRLPILNQDGVPMDDKLVIPGLQVQ